MWLLLLELIAPVAIVLMIHENTRSYFYTWLKNMIICYLMIPMFLLADKFSNEVAGFFMEGKENLGQVTVLVIVCVGVWVKIKMFSVVKAKASNLFRIMKVEKEKYIAVLRQIYGAFCPVGMPLKVKILLALLALVVSFVVMSLKNLIFMQYGS